MAVLESIYNATSVIKIVYLKVEPDYSELERIPLWFADDTWVPGNQPAKPLASPLCDAPFHVFLPIVSGSPTRDHAVGFFEPTTGRMVGYLP